MERAFPWLIFHLSWQILFLSGYKSLLMISSNLCESLVIKIPAGGVINSLIHEILSMLFVNPHGQGPLILNLSCKLIDPWASGPGQ